VIKHHYRGHHIFSVELFESKNQMFKLDHKVALITGANKGIGLEISRQVCGYVTDKKFQTNAQSVGLQKRNSKL